MSSVTINTKTKRSDLSMVLSRWCLGVATCLAVLCFATTGNTQTPWTNPGGGFWHTGANWAGGSPPAPAGTAIFALPNTYNVLWNNGFGDSFNAGLVVGAGNVTFSNTSASTRTYSVSGNSVITGSGATLTVGSFLGNIMQLTSGGLVVNSGGQVVATAGSKISTPGLLTLGSAGSGTLTAQAGGIIDASESRIGDGGSGSALVTGAGSRWDSFDLFVGYNGTGTLNVLAGGVATGSQGRIGHSAGSTGAATVSGSGSVLYNVSALTVGYLGTGTLNVESGGLVDNLDSNIGYGAGSTGTATVTGSGSRWNTRDRFLVGVFGNGMLNVENGGVITDVFGGYVGVASGSTGSATVTGSGSQWNSGSRLWVGEEGTGTLNVAAGGVVTALYSNIGLNSGSTGTATVSGNGSRLNITKTLSSDAVFIVGDYGTGTLNVTNGGLVTSNDYTVIGHYSGSSGTATVTGSGSQWISPIMSVGDGGNGTLNVMAGGVVTNTKFAYVGRFNGSTGAATVTGSGSQWNIPDGLLVGWVGGDGTLNVENGGVVNSGSGSGSGSGGDASSWIGQGSGSATATVTGSGSRWNNSEGLHVGGERTATLNVTNGGLVTNTFGAIGGVSAGVTVTGSGSRWNNSDYLRIGRGILNVQNGGVVTSVVGELGVDPGSPGFATVNGNGSRWNNSGQLSVGHSGGSGMLNVENGGVISSDYGTIGHEAGSSGAATVTGIGSRWDNSINFHVGFNGTGTLNVTAGGVVTNAIGTVAQVAGSTGAATVTGSGSQWNHSNFLVVGNAGTGTLNVAAGGVVNDVQGYIGNEAGSSGVVTVTGSGSQWNSSSLLSVGHTAGSGRLNVENGGVVASSEGFIGFGAGSTGIATVTGSGSRWNNSSFLIAGYFGNGTLNVTAGGVVNNTAGIVGQEIGSTGAATVTGIGSRWNNSSSLEVGRFGTGTLNVAAGGVVTNTYSIVSNEAGSTGAVTVTGSGSQWNNSSELNVGGHGTGTLNVAAGGVVTTAHGLIGRFAGSSGIATVTGTGSQWNNTPFLFVGHEGAGTLNVTAGGVVTAEHSAIGLISGSSGAVTVTGSGSQWNNTGSLIVGHASTGTLNVENGGVVANPQGAVGNLAGSSGTVTVTGSGSQWNNSVDLQVGVSGNGILNIANGGSVNVGNLTTVGADGQINNSDGSFVSNTVINQPGGEILGRGSFSAIGGWSNSGFMAFRGGVSNVYGAVNNLAGGTIFSEFFGTTYFHGDVVHNGVQIAVGAGSRIEFQGTVSGAGNYFSGGTVTMNGAFRPGNSAGVVSFASDLSFGAGASLEIEIGGLTAGSQHDKLSIAGDLALDGELEVSLINGFNPSAGQSFNILDWGSLAGTFSSISLPTLAGLAWNTSQLYTTGVLSVVAAGLPGDYNNNGVVDAGDYVIFRKYAGTSQVLPNDPTGGTIGTAQYTTWRNNYGKPPGSGSANGLGGGEVPEPNSLVLVCLAVAGTLARRRSDRRRSC